MIMSQNVKSNLGEGDFIIFDEIDHFSVRLCTLIFQFFCPAMH